MDGYVIIYHGWLCIGYSPVWKVLWAYNTREIIGRGHSPRQLSQGSYMPLTASKQGYRYFIPWQPISMQLITFDITVVKTIVLYQLVFVVKTVKFN